MFPLFGSKRSEPFAPLASDVLSLGDGDCLAWKVAAMGLGTVSFATVRGCVAVNEDDRGLRLVRVDLGPIKIHVGEADDDGWILDSLVHLTVAFAPVVLLALPTVLDVPKDRRELRSSPALALLLKLSTGLDVLM